ncbi:olfactomedin-like protein 3 [Protopterus annectens]|uniref:olfactomedin-like protein 3 n=1 Tax=Protopterus annectens TaxID=7888 RepID=UPI001CF9EC01|nr:olfactomedin-like protein 3 [Protopterus annectens]
MKSGIVYLAVFLLILVIIKGQDHGLLTYVERRITSIEDRITQFHDQSGIYSSELRDFKKHILTMVENYEKDKEELRSELLNANARIERLEREVDYLESQNPVTPCLEVDDKVVERKAKKVQKKRNEKYDKITDCRDMISHIKSMKILKKMKTSTGLWTKDPLANSDKVYIFSGTANDTLYEFASIRDFSVSSHNRKAVSITLPYPWKGTGHVVYGGFLYYIKEGTEFHIIKFDLKNHTVTDSAVFPAEEQIPAYSLSPFNYIDLAADEEGLWAIFATKENEQNLCLAKMDPKTLDVEQMWDTPCRRENAESAFVACGILYVVYNTRLPSRSRIQCAFDVSDSLTPEEVPLIYFPKRYGSHSSMKYNPKEKYISAWDEGYQIIYRLVMKSKLVV